ncbi:hypothetical protein [Corallococcus carmarthensis]|uniref:hypothetical protein n=1 Tax=Corallococcus carmarthensis TaxID=2316728 RepID=UPI0017A66756|nr:hypothetical protein [Corallococcus carmarthensis]NOK17441.1 hypothetical protein [Corallococcus carmarthensis]
MDSVTNTCRTQPALCTGPESVLPGVRAAEVAVVVAGARAMMDEDTQRAVEFVLKECADLARSQVLLRYHDGQSPSKAQCNETLRNEKGESVSRAMWLGDKMHAAALECAQQKLESLRPGRFSLEPTYRVDRRTGVTTLLSAEEVQLLKQPRFQSELKGTLVPDVVIHEGSPLEANAVYDFKFSCYNVDEPAVWREVPAEGASPGSVPTQKNLYMKALGLSRSQVLRVVPRHGVLQ